MVAMEPLARILDRAGIDTPVAIIGVPAGVHDPKITIFATDIRDIRVTVNK